MEPDSVIMTDFYFDVRRHDRHRRRQSRPSRRCNQSRDLATSRGPTVQGRSVRRYISIRTGRPCTVDPPDAAKSRDRSHPDTGRHRTLLPTQCTDATTPPPHLSTIRVLQLVSISAWLGQPKKNSRLKDPGYGIIGQTYGL